MTPGCLEPAFPSPAPRLALASGYALPDKMYVEAPWVVWVLSRSVDCMEHPATGPAAGGGVSPPWRDDVQGVMSAQIT